MREPKSRRLAELDAAEQEIIRQAMPEVNALLAASHVVLPAAHDTRYAHHLGVSRFRECGIVIIPVINRVYTKKIMVLLADQSHPEHQHMNKDETFFVIYGEVSAMVDGKEYLLKKGDVLPIPPNTWHRFRSQKGCILEEISSRQLPGDSYYRDQRITQIPPTHRVTKVLFGEQ